MSRVVGLLFALRTAPLGHDIKLILLLCIWFIVAV